MVVTIIWLAREMVIIKRKVVKLFRISKRVSISRVFSQKNSNFFPDMKKCQHKETHITGDSSRNSIFEWVFLLLLIIIIVIIKIIIRNSFIKTEVFSIALTKQKIHLWYLLYLSSLIFFFCFFFKIELCCFTCFIDYWFLKSPPQNKFFFFIEIEKLCMYVYVFGW